MSTGLALILLVAFVYTTGILFWLWRGTLQELARSQPSGAPSEEPLSVLIAAHNEEKTLPALLEALSHQQAPPATWEVILVADRCQDGTRRVAQQWQHKLPLRVLEIQHVPPGISPKKYALQQAIEHAQYDRLVFLDADVVPSPQHLQVLSGYLSPEVDVVVGLMKLKAGDDPLGRFLRFERLTNWLVCAGTLGTGSPLLAYGGNWAYRKSAFQQVHGFEGIAHALSGDDDLLLQKFARHGLAIRFCADPRGWVYTHPPPSFVHFWRQRRRHHSAARFYPRKAQLGYASFYLSLLLLWIGALWGGPFLLPLLGRLVLDAWLLRQLNQIFEESLPPWSVLWLQPLWLVYLMINGVAGLIGSPRWR